MKTIFSYLKIMFATCFMIAAFTACSDDDDKGSSPSKIELSSNETEAVLAKPAEGTTSITFEIKFTSTGEWTAKAAHSWLSLDKTKGTAGEHTILVTAKENKEVASRETTITITGNDAEPVIIKVTQHGIDSELVFNKPEGVELEVNNETRTIAGTVEVVSNYNWDVKITEDWLSYEVTESSDNSVGKNVTFYADPAKLSSFSKEATVSFTYKATTKAIPEVISYKVKVDIVPTITFTVLEREGEEFVEKEIEELTLIKEAGSDIYKRPVIITSNFKGSFSQENFPEWLTIGNNTGDNETTQENILTFSETDFFESRQTFIFSLKDEYLNTDGYTNELKVVGENTGEATLPALTVKVESIDSYIAVNTEGFGTINDYNMCYTFGATGTYMSENFQNSTGVDKIFSVKAGNHDDVTFYLLKMENGFPTKTDVNIQTTEESEDYQYWATIEEVETPQIRGLITSKNYRFIFDSRNKQEDYMGGDSSKDRYVALFVVPKSKAPTIADLFDEEGNVKPEYDNFIRIEQKGLKKEYQFTITGLSSEDGKTYNLDEHGNITVPAAAGKYKIEFEEGQHNIDMEADQLQFYFQITGEPHQTGWEGTPAYEADPISPFVQVEFEYVNHSYTGNIYLQIAENTSKDQRIQVACGFAVDIELLCKFDITQEGKK